MMAVIVAVPPVGVVVVRVERDLAARPDGDVVQVVARQRRRRQERPDGQADDGVAAGHRRQQRASA